MMRPTCTIFVPILVVAASIAVVPSAPAQVAAQVPDYARQTQPSQQSGVPRNQTDARALQMQQNDPDQVRLAQMNGQPSGQQLQQTAAQQPANPGAANPNTKNPNAAPFPPLPAAELQRLQQMLMAWEQQSQGTKTLTCKFQRWHYDLFAAPAGIHATKATGEIKYSAPDKGLFRVEDLQFYKGMQEGKPAYGAETGKFGEHWVCNGREVIEFDRSEKKCTIMELPPQMQGTQIFNSPLPFVFNLKADQVQQRYWVREVKSPKEGMFMIEAWPKRQADRSRYKLVVIALDAKTFLPHALIMYAPNFNAKTQPKWDHYEFADVKRNAIRAGMQNFFKNFIPEKPPSDWEVVREDFIGEPEMQATNPQPQPNRK